MALQQLGKLEQGSPDSEVAAFFGFRGGLNVKAAPQLVGDEDLTQAFQGYLRPDGAFQLRNGMVTYGSPVTTGSGQLILARFYQDIKNGTSVAETRSLLGQFNGTLYSIPSSGAATTLGTINGTQMTTCRMQDPNDPNFVSGLTDVTVICTGVAGSGPYIWDGTNLYTPTGWSLASGAAWCATVNGITWFGGIPLYPNQIFGTGDGIIASMESLPAYRNFVLSAPVTGLVAQGTGATATLVIGRSSGVSVLSGTGPSTFYLQDVPFQDGVTAGRTMISANGVVYWLGRNGEYRFDAQTVPSVISKKIEPWILNDPFTPGYPLALNRTLSWSTIYNNRLHLGYCTVNSTPDTILVYDLDLNAWTVLQTQPGLASMCLLDAPGDSSPYGCIAGSSINGQAYTWDYVTAVTTSSNVTDAGVPVLGIARSKYFKLGAPATNKMLERFYPDLLVSGVMTLNFFCSYNYGTQTVSMSSTSSTVVATVGDWDVGFWDACAFDSVATTMASFIPRIDTQAVQGEAFGFGVSMFQASPVWIWSGTSVVFQQGGRT